MSWRHEALNDCFSGEAGEDVSRCPPDGDGTPFSEQRIRKAQMVCIGSCTTSTPVIADELKNREHPLSRSLSCVCGMTSRSYFGMPRSVFFRSVSCSRRYLPYLGGVRQARACKSGLDYRASDVDFGHLPLEAPGIQAMLQLFQLVHHAFRDAAPLVDAVIFPAAGFISVEAFEKPMLVRLRSSALFLARSGTGGQLDNRGMAAFGMVEAIWERLGGGSLEVVEPIWKDFSVDRVGGGYFNADGFLGALVFCLVNLAPSVGSVGSVWAHLPTVGFKTGGGVNRGFMHLPFRPFSSTKTIQAGRPTRLRLDRQTGKPYQEPTYSRENVGVYRQRTHQRRHQSLGGAVRQWEQPSDHQTGLDVRVQLHRGLNLIDRSGEGAVVFRPSVAGPDRQSAPLKWRPVVYGPVRLPMPRLQSRLAGSQLRPRCHRVARHPAKPGGRAPFNDAAQTPLNQILRASCYSKGSMVLAAIARSGRVGI